MFSFFLSVNRIRRCQSDCQKLAGVSHQVWSLALLHKGSGTVAALIFLSGALLPEIPAHSISTHNEARWIQALQLESVAFREHGNK